MDIDVILQKQRAYFQSGATLPVSFRIAMLKKLLAAVNKYEKEIGDALTDDLGKSDFEGFMCETGLVRSEISYMIKHVKHYAREKTVYTPITQFASRSYRKPSPYGNVLIMSPWNYPFLLTIDPLADAIAAGNTAIVKPSAYSPATSAVIEKIIIECFDPEYVAVVTGGRKENAALLEKKFDLIFFTGSQSVGKEVLRHTAETLTPAILELGGKSPCIVDSTAKIKLAANKAYINTDITNKEFYDRMRQGASAKTAAINADAFARAFEPILQADKDILYVAFSSGLSTTINSAHMAAQELKEQYPDRKIVIVDTLAASAGSGLMVYMAVAKKKEGASLEENAAYIESLTPHHCIWFTVDDLEYLKRGGRVSPLVAFAGSILGIKPILQMDSEGHLVKVSTARGRKKAIESLADKYTELSYEEQITPIFISHAQCEEDAKQLADILVQRHRVEVSLITEIGPVIGSHAGPGTLAIFFIGKHR